MTTRKRPAGNRPSPTSRATDYSQSSGDYRHQAPTADERREARLLEELRNLGYGITVPCEACGHPLSTAKSVASHIGPKCAAKVVGS